MEQYKRDIICSCIFMLSATLVYGGMLFQVLRENYRTSIKFKHCMLCKKIDKDDLLTGRFCPFVGLVFEGSHRFGINEDAARSMSYDVLREIPKHCRYYEPDKERLGSEKPKNFAMKVLEYNVFNMPWEKQ